MVEQQIGREAYRAALDLIETWPDDALEQTGPDFQLLWGYLVYKCRDFHTAVKILEPLWERRPSSRRRPALLYYLGPRLLRQRRLPEVDQRLRAVDLNYNQGALPRRAPIRGGTTRGGAAAGPALKRA